jgi:hypothetical protein
MSPAIETASSRFPRWPAQRFVVPNAASADCPSVPSGRRDGQRAEAALTALGNLVDVTRDIASRAAQLRATRNIKLPDALILATAMQVAADEILTLDRRWRGLDSRVRLLEVDTARDAAIDARFGDRHQAVAGHLEHRAASLRVDQVSRRDPRHVGRLSSANPRDER